ncbi:MAG: hypothetical protein V4669_05240 [Pseudomonadota bacterium]
MGTLKELRPLSVIPAADFDVFEAQVNSQQANLLRQFGSAHGYELVREDKLGSRLLRFQYVVFHEKAAMRWNFVAYKAEKGWVLSHFAFDANAVSFFSNSSMPETSAVAHELRSNHAITGPFDVHTKRI